MEKEKKQALQEQEENQYGDAFQRV